MKALLVDDESNARLLMRSLIDEHFPEVTLCGEAANVPDAVKLIHQHQPDLVFLDIEMPGYTGLELVDFFRQEERKFHIVFVSAYSEFAIQAFEQSATDYLLKPVRKEKLERVIHKIAAQRQVIQSPVEGSLLEDKIAIPSSEGTLLIRPTEISYIKADGSYVHIHLQDSRKLTVAKKLNDFSRLEDKGFFLRVHRSYMININHIKRLLKQDRGTIVMHDETEIPVSQEKKADLQWFMERFKL